MSQTIHIGHQIIGSRQRPFIIAELSGNHQQNYQLAEQMIEAAAQAGAHAIKLQTYTADTMTLDINSQDFMLTEENSLWQGESLYSLYSKAATPWEWHEPLFAKARSLGLLAFSSPFDASAVDFLENLDVPCYKIASFENTDLPLIKKVAQTGKPLIVSTGMASEQEIEELLATISDSGNRQVVLLKCTSNYPADASDCNLLTLVDMQSKFGTLVGLSDHSLGNSVALAAVALGSCVIEKHFVLDRRAGGVDAEFSLEADELKQLVQETETVWRAMGKVQYGGSENEQASKKYRRSVYSFRDIKAGECLSEQNIRVIRPGFGLPPKHYEQLLGKTARQDIPRGTPIRWELLQ